MLTYLARQLARAHRADPRAARQLSRHPAGLVAHGTDPVQALYAALYAAGY